MKIPAPNDIRVDLVATDVRIVATDDGGDSYVVIELPWRVAFEVAWAIARVAFRAWRFKS